jgi:hypothetical protein
LKAGNVQMGMQPMFVIWRIESFITACCAHEENFTQAETELLNLIVVAVTGLIKFYFVI